MNAINRGDVYRIAFGEARGHELKGPHYAVVVQSDAYPLSTLLVVPLSSSAQPAAWRAPVQIAGQQTYALVEQARAVDVQSRLREWICNIAGSEEMAQIDEELAAILGIDEAYRNSG